MSDRWPQLMRRKTAAAYLDMSVETMERQINAGKLPTSVLIGRIEYWRKDAIDAALVRLDGGIPDYEREFYENGKAA